VRCDGRPSAGDPETNDWFYAVEGEEVFRIPVAGSGVSRSRYGRTSATLVVGDHPLADSVRPLNIARSWAAEFSPDRQLWLAGPPERLGPAGRKIDPRSVGEATQAQLVVSPKPGIEFEVDQGFDRLGWEPDAVFAGPGLHDRASQQDAEARSPRRAG
jgi:hypothetical protein